MEPPSLPSVSSSAADAALDDPAAWEWSHLLDFPIDVIDDVILPLSPPAPPQLPPPLLKVRKRDPRLLCGNFLAGRVPCACPELDAAVEEEEEAAVGMAEKKRAKRGGAGTGAPARCQVPGCEVDISELKGYHKRHRVCLRCANAASVPLEGEAQRYCQQCGKFHLLEDFDEGKRSCRRKLERHNKRRRRRSTDNENAMEKNKGLEGSVCLDVIHGESKKESTDGASLESDSLCIDDKTLDAEGLLDSEGHGSPYCSDPIIHIGHSNNVGSCAVSSDTQIEERVDNPKSAISSSFYGNRSTYSTLCPTGRISFKLYDWNPAEFPRRLRLQVFQWLASMPVELEGYIRPGCTILTIFIAMPQMMWTELSNDTARYLHQFLKEPDNLLFRRGSMHIYLNNTLYQVLRDGSSLVNVKMEVQVPRLHYVHPLVFEAGKPVEFIVCGSNLLQPNFRFLVSFAGKYLAVETCRPTSYGHTMTSQDIGETEEDLEHQIFRVNFPYIEAEVFGPAFIEVENECGLSNFIPILFANKYICSELQNLQQLYDLDPMAIHVRNTGSLLNLCEAHVSRQSKISELLLDIAWILREPQMEGHGAFFSTANVQRITNLVNYLTENNSVYMLQKVVHYIDSYLEAFNTQQVTEVLSEACTANVELFQACMSMAKLTLEKHFPSESFKDLGPKSNCVPQQDDKFQCDSVLGVSDHVLEDAEVIPPLKQKRFLFVKSMDESHPLLARHGLLSQAGSGSCHMQYGWPVRSWGLSRKIISPRLAVLVMASIFVCCGLCAALLHPRMAGRLVVSARRCISHVP